MSLRKIEAGHYVWTGRMGEYHLRQIDHWTFCEGPHPERRRDHQGLMVTGYCQGDQEHPTTSWVCEVASPVGTEVGMGFDTRREALAAAQAADEWAARR